MALMRCDDHAPTGRDEPYVRRVQPMGWPDTALVCGQGDCKTAALIWLKQAEADAYVKGRRIFKLPNNAATKVKAA